MAPPLLAVANALLQAKQQRDVANRDFRLAEAERARAAEDRQRRQALENLSIFEHIRESPTLSAMLAGGRTATTAPAEAAATAGAASLGGLAALPGMGASPVLAPNAVARAGELVARQATARPDTDVPPAVAALSAQVGGVPYAGSVAARREAAFRALNEQRPGQYGTFDPNVDYEAVQRKERDVMAAAKRFLAAGLVKDLDEGEILARDNINPEDVRQEREDQRLRREAQRAQIARTNAAAAQEAALGGLTPYQIRQAQRAEVNDAKRDVRDARSSRRSADAAFSSTLARRPKQSQFVNPLTRMPDSTAFQDAEQNWRADSTEKAQLRAGARDEEGEATAALRALFQGEPFQGAPSGDGSANPAAAASAIEEETAQLREALAQGVDRAAALQLYDQRVRAINAAHGIRDGAAP